VAVAGSDASDHPEVYLSAGADVVLIGEGERTLAELVATLSGQSRRPLSDIAGLAFRNPVRGGPIVRTAPRADETALDTLPPPAWDLVDVQRYRDVWTRAHGRLSLNLVSTRGCPYHCTWCAKPIWGQRYHVHSPERVAADLATLRHDHGAGHVWFADDIFGLRPGWIARFADVLAERGLRVPFTCQTRADLLLRDGEVDALRRAGAEMVWIGAESGSQRILDAMEKGTTVAEIQEAARRVHAAGLGIGFFLQFGYPGESRHDIAATFALVRRCRPDDIGVSVAYPLPHTRFYEQVRDRLGDVDHWVDSSDLAMLYRGPQSTAFYRQLHAVLHREFRARRSWQALGRRAGTSGSPVRDNARHLRTLALNLVRWPVDRARLAWLARSAGDPPPEPARPAGTPVARGTVEETP
jgi:radical SAM superfamily enzyme YgiQ (UPF0313 family)